MKNIFLVSLLVSGISIGCNAQSSSSIIKGTVANSVIRYVYVELSHDKSTTIDSIAVKDGVFEKGYAADLAVQAMVSLDRPLSLLNQLSMQGKKVDLSPYFPVVGNENSPVQTVLRPILCEMIPRPKESKLLVFLNPGEEVNLTIPKEGIKYAEVQGNAKVAEYVAFLRKIVPIELQDEEVEKQFKTYEGELNNGVIAKFDNQLTALKKQKSTEAVKFIKANPSSPYAYSVILEYMYQDFKLLNEVCKVLDEKIWSSKEGASLKRNLMRYSKAPEGSTAFDFTITDSKGNAVTLSQVKGKVILVEFWASWCAPCRAENPYLAYINERYKDKGFTLISFSLDNKKESWLDALGKDKMTWLNVSDLEGVKSSIANEYGVRGIPANFLIYNGKIIAVNLRKQLLNEKLQEILK